MDEQKLSKGADRNDLAWLDAETLVSKHTHPDVGVSDWIEQTSGGAGLELVAAVMVGAGEQSEEAVGRLGVALGLVIDRHPNELWPLRVLAEFKATSKMRHKDVWQHTLKVVTNCTEYDPVLRLGALLHDLGKPQTRAHDPHRGVTFDGHEVVGAEMTAKMLLRLNLPQEMVYGVTRLVRYHLRAHQATDFSDAAVRRYVLDVGPLWVSRLNRLAEADVTSRYADRRQKVADKTDLLRARITEVVYADTRRAVRPPIDGSEVSKRLGVPPGVELGRYMAALNREAVERWERGEPFTAVEAWEMVEAMGQAQS